jgi:hypothetical protein
MKNAFNSILILTVVGLAVLVAGAVFFGAPLFGWIIMMAIFAVFVIDQFRLLSALKTMSSDEDGFVSRRLSQARELLGRGVRLDSAIAFEVLSNNSSVPAPRSSGGTVILLGLMGTFFGLMYSVATAGVAIDNSTTQGTLDTIQVLFGNMKGIFGTSLCGLFAALVLGISRGLFLGSREAFIARLDSLTLDLQGESAGENEKSKDELGRLFDAVEKNLARVAESVQQGLNGVVSKVGEELSSTTSKLNSDLGSMVSKLEGSLGNLGSSVGNDVANALGPINDYMKNLQTSVEALPSRLDDKLNGISSSLNSNLNAISSCVKEGLSGVAASTEKSMDGAVKNIADCVSAQVKQSDEQWKAFMDKLASESSASTESQKQGLETLKNVALQVAEKAQAGSAELSNSVAEKLSALSNDILTAFQKLSETSATLLEAQKALTESIDNRVVKEKEATDALGGNIVETAELMRVNQSELSANLEMLRAGLETILEKLSGDTAEHEEEENFVEHLNQSLEAFHERASEVLVENAVKTQEILLEVLEQAQRASIAHNAPKAEG